MFKLQFFRTTAPCGPSWNCTLVPRPFKDSGDSKTKQAIWEAVWCWLTGEQNVVDASVVAAWLASGDEVQLLPVQIYNVQIHIINWLAAYRLAGSKHPSCCAEQIGDLERTVQSSNREIDRVGAAYALGSLAGNDIVSSRHRQQDALKALDRLLEGQNNARRAAMYGIASAGMSAVDLLVERISRPDDYPLSVVVAAVFALGEACTQPTTKVVAELGNLLVHWRHSMGSYCAEVASAAADQREVSMTERAYLTSGGANSMNPMDGYATALQRGTSTVSTHALICLAPGASNLLDCSACCVELTRIGVVGCTWDRFICLLETDRVGTWNAGRASGCELRHGFGSADLQAAATSDVCA
jgi:hypothetical protein